MKPFDNVSREAVKMFELGVASKSILIFLAQEAEKIIGHGCVVSILVLDKQGLLRNGASPHLPADYLAAIDGIKPDPRVGTCAAAAATGQAIETPDFRADDKWAELRHLPLSIGFSGAWSMPIKTGEGKVLGTFGTYYREPRRPSSEEILGIKLLASTASAILSANE